MAEVLRARWRLFRSPGELAVCSSRSSSCHFPPAVIVPPSPFLFLFPCLAHHSISPSFFFRCHTFPCLLSRDNYHYLSSLQGSVCSAEMRSVKGRWESIHSEGKAINTHTHSHTAAPRRLVTTDGGEPITKLWEVNRQQRRENFPWPWTDYGT